jgi:ornithine cyclodeaminase
MAMIGAGGQSREQIRAVCAVRRITEVRIASLTNEHSPRLISTLLPDYPNISFVKTTDNSDAIRGADIVCTATVSTQPVFQARDLAEAVHVNAIGAYRPDMCELPPEVLRGASVVAVDSLSAAMAEAGDVVQAISTGHLRRADINELGALLANTHLSRQGHTVFKSVGIAAQDLAIADLVVRKARALGGVTEGPDWSLREF